MLVVAVEKKSKESKTLSSKRLQNSLEQNTFLIDDNGEKDLKKTFQISITWVIFIFFFPPYPLRSIIYTLLNDNLL